VPALRDFFEGVDIARSFLKSKASRAMVRLVEFDANVSPPHVMRCDERGTGTAEWVHDDAAGRTEGVDKRLKRVDWLLRGVQRISAVGKINDIRNRL
jgi:hypothetical protein